MFDPVDPKQSFPDLEKGILDYWRYEDTFKRSLKHRENAPAFSFYDGPPFATGLPHYGHLLAGTIKDVIPRYQTMKGNYVERRFGWDCHGLPIENLVEKENNITNKQEIEEKGVKWFNALCRNSVQRYTNEWRKTVERTGRWVDMDWDYRTMDPEFMESIWWVFQSLHKKGLIYEGLKPMHICPRCATPLSNFEVTQGYKDITDLGVTVKFELEESKETKETKDSKEKTYLLAWTTTPWTLPGNLFLAVNPKARYVKFLHRDASGEQLYIASVDFYNKLHVEADNYGNVPPEESYEPLKGTYSIDGQKTFDGDYLLGSKYKPLFPYFAEKYKGSFRVVDGSSFVTTSEGTGIVHIAPGFGEDDYEVGKREGVPVLQHVTIDGKFTKDVTDFAGQDVKPADDPSKMDRRIAEKLKKEGKLFDEESYRHSYPHCWRCDSPLLNYATSCWFVAVEKMKKNMLKANAETRWVPSHIRDGRFGKWLEGARDWAISRNRYWGTPLPIWRCTETGELRVLGSRDELMAIMPKRFTKVTVLRHAQSEGNIDQIYQGALPGTPLTKEGEEQAKRAAELLSSSEAAQSLHSASLRSASVEKSAAESRGISAIYCSPLARTKRTAEVIGAAHKVEVTIDERLREIGFGEYEGQHIDFSDLSYVKSRREHKFQTGRPESIYHLAGMEAYEAVHERIEMFLKEVLAQHRGEHIVIVTHADPVQNIRHFFTQEDPFKLSHQPYPSFAHPYTFFFDHETGASLDLHKETVDDIVWKEGDKEFKRIPEVLDCWFESGSMPYAQGHFPFESDLRQLTVNNSQLTQTTKSTVKGQQSIVREPRGFPADFIAEGLDQTRGWFYTLMVLSTGLFGKPAFQNCIVNGIVLAEDGRKMSKRLKNYPEPNAIMEKYGADAMRFALMASPAVRGEDLRFSEKYVEEVLRRVLLPLWNAYSFFVTYANDAGWDRSIVSTKHQIPNSKNQQTSKPANCHPLDSWLLAEVQDLVNRMTEQLDHFDLSATCAELHETIDCLTDWYIRRSRRRFAGKESAVSTKHQAPNPKQPLPTIALAKAEANQPPSKLSAEHAAAFSTLHHVLLTVSKLLAPFCPFITEEIYLNLHGDEHDSIHLSDWPLKRELTNEETKLIERTRLLRTIVSLGMKLRSEAKIKVRQPLSHAEVMLPGGSLLTEPEQTILQEELNVREIRIVRDASTIAERFVQVDARKVGPRLGGKVQDIIRAAKEGKFEEKGDSLVILGETLSPEEAVITFRGKEGHAVASERGVVLSLDTTVNEELEREGLARDVIRAIQSFRKEKGLKVSDRVTLEAGKGLEEVLKIHQLLIEKETNGSFGKPQENTLHIKIELQEGKISVMVSGGEP